MIHVGTTPKLFIYLPAEVIVQLHRSKGFQASSQQRLIVADITANDVADCHHDGTIDAASIRALERNIEYGQVYTIRLAELVLASWCWNQHS